jgi:hypothetical protein
MARRLLDSLKSAIQNRFNGWWPAALLLHEMIHQKLFEGGEDA